MSGRRVRGLGRGPAVDMSVSVGSVRLPNPVMTASGTGGHGAELEAYQPLADLGAVVVKSMSVDPWPGNPAPRVHSTPAGMLNSVGLQGTGVAAWLAEDLPGLIATGTRVVASIWGRSVADYRAAAEALAAAPAEVVAVEVNLSCPNTEAGRDLFAHDPAVAAEVIAATEGCGRPRWAKLSPNTSRVAEVAQAVGAAGAEAVTLINTLMGMAIDPETRSYRLGSAERGGGLSGPAIHPVAVRLVHDVSRAVPGLPIIGVGGVTDAPSAVEMLLAGAVAIQVGTATFADPRAPSRVARDLEHWCRRRGVRHVSELSGGMR